MFVVSAAACGDANLKAQGQECFGSTECEEGLTCDFGQTPSVCAPNQTSRPDASVEPAIDADLLAPDADPAMPDAMPLPDGDPGAVALTMTPMPNQDCGTDPAGLLAGQGSLCATYTVTNVGGLTSGALGVVLNDTVNFEVVTDTCAGNTFATDATCTIAVGHRPQDVAVAHNATLTVSEATLTDLTRTMSGQGVSALTSVPPNNDFGDIVSGNTSAPVEFTITNAANTPATGTLTATLAGASPGEYSLDSTCAGATVPAAGTCTVTVTFAPTAVAAAVTASVDVTDGTANKTVSIGLTGNGI